MASNLNPTFSYTVVYVQDVAKSVAFYANAFGYNVRRLNQSRRWGELESGQTTIAFTPLHQRDTDILTGTVQTPGVHQIPPVEICLAYTDVDAAYRILSIRSCVFLQNENNVNLDVIRTVLRYHNGNGCSVICNCIKQRAVENGAVPVNPPEDKNWGQRVGYVRDIDGIVVRMESHLNPEGIGGGV